MSPWEITANAFNALSIFLAGRNHVHTWWTGIVGCLLFGYVFFGAKLYADLTLQVFFVVTSVVGWWNWQRGEKGIGRPIRRTAPSVIGLLGVAALIVVAAYGLLLHRFTDAYAPFLDSTILVFSVLGQFLLMDRRLENWWCWLLVNTIAIPLYAARGLSLTSALSAIFWINAIVSWVRWKQELHAAHETL
jgi:nicotinamide mononucleotide transporter